MGKLAKKRIVIMLLVSLFLTDRDYHSRIVQAAEVSFVYRTEQGEMGIRGNPGDAFDMIRKYGGTVTVYEDCRLEPKNVQGYLYIPEHTTLIISEETKFEPGDVDIYLEGTIQVGGTLDLSGGKGIILGDGDIVVEKEGSLIRQIPAIERNGEICLWGSTIKSGQSLAASKIEKDKVAWKAAVAGEWIFTQPDRIPGVGTGLYPVLFIPENRLTYQPVFFSSCGQVTVEEKMENRKPENSGAVTEKRSDDNNAASKEDTKKQETTEVEIKTGQPPVIITKFVSQPSAIYTKSKSFQKKRPRFLHVVRPKKGRQVRLKWSSVPGKTGYEIRFSGKKSMAKAEKKYTKKNKMILRGVKKRKVYYLRVRAYKGKKKKRTCTKWSSIIKV